MSNSGARFTHTLFKAEYKTLYYSAGESIRPTPTWCLHVIIITYLFKFGMCKVVIKA